MLARLWFIVVVTSTRWVNVGVQCVIAHATRKRLGVRVWNCRVFLLSLSVSIRKLKSEAFGAIGTSANLLEVSVVRPSGRL